jgi:hypothetical protein
LHIEKTRFYHSLLLEYTPIKFITHFKGKISIKSETFLFDFYLFKDIFMFLLFFENNLFTPLDLKNAKNLFQNFVMFSLEKEHYSIMMQELFII